MGLFFFFFAPIQVSQRLFILGDENGGEGEVNTGIVMRTACMVAERVAIGTPMCYYF